MRTNRRDDFREDAHAVSPHAFRDDALMREALQRLRPEANLGDKSADFVRGALEEALRLTPPAPRGRLDGGPARTPPGTPEGAQANANPYVDRDTGWLRKSVVGTPTLSVDPVTNLASRDWDGDMDDLEKKNKAAKQRSADAWKTPIKGALTRDSIRRTK